MGVPCTIRLASPGDLSRRRVWSITCAWRNAVTLTPTEELGNGLGSGSVCSGRRGCRNDPGADSIRVADRRAHEPVLNEKQPTAKQYEAFFFLRVGATGHRWDFLSPVFGSGNLGCDRLSKRLQQRVSRVTWVAGIGLERCRESEPSAPKLATGI
jgi:hypothetical protein